jgi:nucleotide-binding universal stress UspA family protein
MVQLHPLGILLAFVFAIAVSSLFLWMFRMPPVLPLSVIKVHRSVTALRKILVPVVEAISSERAVELACRLGHDQKAELILAHVIVVPYTMALDVALPEREQAAREIIRLGHVIAQRYGSLARDRIVRHRNAAEGILQVAREEEVDAIVLGVGVKPRVPGEWGRTSIEVLRRASCEVIVDKVPLNVEKTPLAA